MLKPRLRAASAAVPFGFGSLMPVEPPISFLILDGVDSRLGALAGAGRNSQIKAVEAFALLFVVAGRFCADRCRNFRKESVVVRIGHLKRSDKTLATRHVDAFAVAIEVKIVAVLDARHRGNELA